MTTTKEKRLTLGEARETGKIRQFAQQHPSVGDKRRFDKLLDAMAHGGPPDSQARKKPKAARTSKPGIELPRNEDGSVGIKFGRLYIFHIRDMFGF